MVEIGLAGFERDAVLRVNAEEVMEGVAEPSGYPNTGLRAAELKICVYCENEKSRTHIAGGKTLSYSR